MGRNKVMIRSTVESLEPRQLFAATFPNMLGQFSGLVTFSTGTTDSEILTVLSQKNGSFSGEVFQGSGATSKTSGSVNKRGIIHTTTHGINVKFSSKFIGAIFGDTISGSFVTKQGKLKLTGVVSLTRSAT
jgi:hypothetical protein